MNVAQKLEKCERLAKEINLHLLVIEEQIRKSNGG